MDMFVEHRSNIIKGLSVDVVGWPWKKSVNVKGFECCIPQVLIKFFQATAAKMSRQDPRPSDTHTLHEKLDMT